MTVLLRNHTPHTVKKVIAGILLQNALDKSPGKPRLAQRDMAEIAGADWRTVNESLKNLRAEGAIRIEGSRIIINRELLQATIAAG